MRLEQIDTDMLNRAVDLYLCHAYPDEAQRAVRRVGFEPGRSAAAVLDRFERDSAGLENYTLRLGSRHYPHMKLALREAYETNEYVFSVDRHDKLSFDAGDQGYEQWLELKSKNHLVKAAIETAWYETGLPTLRSLREQRRSRSGIIRELSERRVLIVDNDPDASAIVEMILASGGYSSFRASGLRGVQELLQDPQRRDRVGLALVDLLLGDGNGRDVVRALRDCRATRRVPIVLSTAMAPQDVRLDGVDAFLRKPYADCTLTELVGQMLQSCSEDAAFTEGTPGGGRKATD